jgi:D-alanyl-D-alanine carboxypeptidase
VCQARIQAKTGMLGHINALSGYATTLEGDRVVFSIFANNHNLKNGAVLDAMDRIACALVNDVPSRGRPR